jgi:hypothetical protein
MDGPGQPSPEGGTSGKSALERGVVRGVPDRVGPLVVHLIQTVQEQGHPRGNEKLRFEVFADRSPQLGVIAGDDPLPISEGIGDEDLTQLATESPARAFGLLAPVAAFPDTRTRPRAEEGDAPSCPRVLFLEVTSSAGYRGIEIMQILHYSSRKWSAGYHLWYWSRPRAAGACLRIDRGLPDRSHATVTVAGTVTPRSAASRRQKSCRRLSRVSSPVLCIHCSL